MGKSKVEVRKETLCDWAVVLNGTYVAWITKRQSDRTYVVTFKGGFGEYVYGSFRDAKSFAIEAA